MIDKPVYIIIAVYCASFSMLGAQFLADSYGITLVAQDGTPIRSAVLDYIRIGSLNTFTSSLPTENSTLNAVDAFAEAFFVGYQLVWDLFLLFTGFYIFNVIALFGVPAIFVIPITGIYIIMLGLFIIAKIRGV